MKKANNGSRGTKEDRLSRAVSRQRIKTDHPDFRSHVGSWRAVLLELCSLSEARAPNGHGYQQPLTMLAFLQQGSSKESWQADRCQLDLSPAMRGTESSTCYPGRSNSPQLFNFKAKFAASNCFPNVIGVIDRASVAIPFVWFHYINIHHQWATPVTIIDYESCFKEWLSEAGLWHSAGWLTLCD